MGFVYDLVTFRVAESVQVRSSTPGNFRTGNAKAVLGTFLGFGRILDGASV